MKGILSYDSKVMGVLDVFANTMILNALFLLCSIPIVTVGASYTALYSGCRAMAKKEPCFKAFFKGFTSSFKRATLAWLILCPLIVLFAFNTIAILFYRMDGYIPPLVISIITLIFLLSVTTMVFVFYSRFECTLGQLLKNSALMVLAHPFRSLAVGVLSWLPVLLFFLDPVTFLQLVVVWVFLYFAGVATVAVWLMNKPFRVLAQRLLGENEAQDGQGEAGQKAIEAADGETAREDEA